MDAHVFRLLGDDLKRLLYRARVEKIHAPAEDLLVLRVFSGGLKRNLALRFGRASWLYLAGSPPPNPAAPPAWVMRLRKHAQGHRLGTLKMDWAGLRLALSLPGALLEPPLWMILDLREGPSLSLELPEGFESSVAWPDPETALKSLQEADQDLWRTFPAFTPAMRKTLANMDSLEARALLLDLELDAEQGRGTLYFYARAGRPPMVSAWPLAERDLSPLPLPASELPYLDAVSLAAEPEVLATLGLAAEKSALEPQKTQSKRLKRLKAKLDEEEARLTGLLAARETARLIQASLWRFDPDEKLAELELKGEADPEAPPLRLKLDPLLSLKENMAAMFKKSARGIRGLKIIEERRKQVQADEAALALGQTTPRARAHTPKDKETAAQSRSYDPRLVQRFISSDGFVLLRGRSAQGNQALLKMALPHDLWLHAEDGPSAHLIIRLSHAAQEVPEQTMNEAGILVALKSRYRDDLKARIMCARVADVKSVKGAKAGTVQVRRALPGLVVAVAADLEARLAQ